MCSYTLPHVYIDIYMCMYTCIRVCVYTRLYTHMHMCVNKRLIFFLFGTFVQRYISLLCLTSPSTLIFKNFIWIKISIPETLYKILLRFYLRYKIVLRFYFDLNFFVFTLFIQVNHRNGVSLFDKVH